MEHILSLESDNLAYLRENIFPKINNGETILFLGAGASVTDEKKYLSSEIMEYYSDNKGIRLETNDITDFVDTLTYKRDFNRDEFDEFVITLLKKYVVSETHRTIAAIKWKEIITTNFDLLIEKAFDEIRGTVNESSKCIPIRKVSEYSYRPANDEIKYVKLNGCISDKRKYPLVFSTKDFESSNRYYKVVLKSLENLSAKINFLSVGYSFKDDFAKKLLDKFDSYNFRAKRWLFNLDPFVEEDRLDYFSEKRICIIKSTAKDFFLAYKKWEEENAGNQVARNQIFLKSTQNKAIPISAKVKLRVNGSLIQLSEENSYPRMTPIDFYGGEQPNFQVIKDDLDVVKQRSINDSTLKVKQLLFERKTIIPTLILEGAYGTGKTTLTYRVVDMLINDEEINGLAYEVIDPYKLQSPDLEEIFSKSGASNIILFFNGIELDSAFKGLIRLRNQLSVEQFHSYNIIFLASMRENILAKFLKEHEYRNFHTLKIEESFNETEVNELVSKLNDANLVQYRDAKQKQALVSKIINEYKGDTLVSLINLVSEGLHYGIIRDAYYQLDKNTSQKVYLFTSLLYRFGILMPSGLLRKLIDISWDSFIKDVSPFDLKNFIIQETISAPGTDPDLYFRTKHPIISDKLVAICLPSEDERYEKYEYLLRKLTYSDSNIRLAINLLKTIFHSKDLSNDKIDRLFDICGQEFHEDPYFNLHYAINLQHRNNENSLKKGIQRITFAEAFLEKRNHRLIHRKAVICFQLAKLFFEKEGLQLRETYNYIDQAKDFFEIKLILDPFTSYSYVDYILFEMWCFNNFNYDEIETIRRKIRIEDLLDQAEKSVLDNIDEIIKIKSKFLLESRKNALQEVDKYEEFLNLLCNDINKKPYGLILSFYYYQNNKLKVNKIISELESFSYLDEVAKILFRYYGRNLHKLNNRIKFLEIIRKHSFLKEKDLARFYYYSYVNEAYNHHFDSAFGYLSELKSKFGYLNPEIQETWKDDDTDDDKIFEGYIILVKGKWKRIKIPELQKTFDLGTRSPKNIDSSENTNHKVKLHFFLTGIKAEIAPK